MAKAKKKSSGRIETTMIRARHIAKDDKKSVSSRATRSTAKKKQPGKLLQIPSFEAIKKYVKRQNWQGTSAPARSLPPQFDNDLSLKNKYSTEESPWGMGTETAQHPSPKKVFVDNEEIPDHYNKTWLGLLVKDPHWIYATWEISEEDLRPCRPHLEDPYSPAKIVLRMYDVTCIQFNGHNANHYFDLEVGRANNWYINLWGDHGSYCAEIGVRTVDGKFTALRRSNYVQTPRTGCSGRSEQIWMEVKDQTIETPYVVARLQPLGPLSQQFSKPPFKAKARQIYLTVEDIRRYYSRLMPFLNDIISARLGKLSARRILPGYCFVPAEDAKERQAIYTWIYGPEFLQKFRLGASEEAFILGKGLRAGASEQLGSSEKILIEKQRKFFFEIWADVIVYGRTEPDAKVSLGNQKINLRPDGTFTLRYALPDTTIPLAFTAISGDQLEKREITTVVNRQTQYFLPVMLEGKFF